MGVGCAVPRLFCSHCPICFWSSHLFFPPRLDPKCTTGFHIGYLPAFFQPPLGILRGRLRRWLLKLTSKSHVVVSVSLSLPGLSFGMCGVLGYLCGTDTFSSGNSCLQESGVSRTKIYCHRVERNKICYLGSVTDGNETTEDSRWVSFLIWTCIVRSASYLRDVHKHRVNTFTLFFSPSTISLHIKRMNTVHSIHGPSSGSKLGICHTWPLQSKYVFCIIFFIIDWSYWVFIGCSGRIGATFVGP